VSLSNVHISNPSEPTPIFPVEGTIMPQLIKTSEGDEGIAPKARTEYVPHVTTEIPYPSAPFPENKALIALQAEFTENETRIGKEFHDKEIIRRRQNFVDSNRMKELGLEQPFSFRVQQEDAEMRSRHEHEKSERSKIQVALELQAVKHYKMLRTGHDRERYLLEQTNLISVHSSKKLDSPFMQQMTSKALQNTCTGLAALLVEDANPTIKTGANKLQVELAKSTFRGTKGDTIKMFLKSKVHDDKSISRNEGPSNGGTLRYQSFG
jgi:hypothetical protein